jgi:hypothetical protein
MEGVRSGPCKSAFSPRTVSLRNISAENCQSEKVRNTVPADHEHPEETFGSYS